MIKELSIKSEINNLRKVEKIIDEISAKAGINKTNYGKILVSTMEAVNNAVAHGNKYDKEKEVKITIDYRRQNLKVTVEDEGKGFNYSNLPDPTAPENIEKLTGRGVFLMRKLADDVTFNESGNKVTLIFKNIND
ncbi:MAG TPA: ATP-binding protein [Bacteroidales bacterium]|nr:ATP-binding protein [Bacteroidales bacterium]HOU96064.1 ATP-binding protein [Bacteroidales bacterium]HQG36975.1 ATP-binding protein [Bacteroidales bacterium]HRC90335.1 ATP-binding protein [Bacteroidales bacterium]